MIKFNTTTLEALTKKSIHTSIDLVKILDDTLLSHDLDCVKKELLVEDSFAVIDYAVRCGLYQGFTIPFGYRLALNGYTLEVTRLPIIGKIIFKLTNKSGYTLTTRSYGKLHMFLKEVAEANS